MMKSTLYGVPWRMSAIAQVPVPTSLRSQFTASGSGEDGAMASTAESMVMVPSCANVTVLCPPCWLLRRPRSFDLVNRQGGGRGAKKIGTAGNGECGENHYRDG